MFSTSSHATSSEPSNAPFQTYILPPNPFRRSSRISSAASSFSSSVFSRRKSSSTSTATVDTAHTSLSTSSTSPGALEPPSYLSSAAGTISCSRCHADLALTSQIVSKGFTGRHGRAYLLSSVEKSPNIIPTPESKPYKPSGAPGRVGETGLPNTILHRAVSRHLVTGMHTVSDLSCAMCGNVLGWKYVSAEEEAQRYKVGNFILESRRTLIGACWDGAGGKPDPGQTGTAGDEEEEDCDAFDYGVEGWTGPSRKGKSHSADGEEDEDIMFDSQDEDECEDLFAGIWTPETASQRRSRRI